MKKQKQSIGLFVVVAVLYFLFPQFFSEQETIGTDSSKLETLYASKKSDEMVQITGKVIKRLKDDLEGSRHQKFLIKVNDHTLLIAHNIDLAQRVPLKEGDFVEIYGEYEWNEKGGVVHWTHKDPNNRHPHGWIKHNKITYQ